MAELSWDNVITKFDCKPTDEFIKVRLEKVKSYNGTMNVRLEHYPEPYYCSETNTTFPKRWMILCEMKPNCYGVPGQRLSDMVEGLKAGYNAAMTKANCHI